MIARYAVLAERITYELGLLQTLLAQCERAMERSQQNPADRDLYVAAMALHLHDFYSGIERVLEMIAMDLDGNVPSGRAWHRELLTQMTLDLPDVRPAVLTKETVYALDEYLRFRHVVRNVYTVQLELRKFTPLIAQLRPTYQRLCADLEVFARFLDCVSKADQEQAQS